MLVLLRSAAVFVAICFIFIASAFVHHEGQNPRDLARSISHESAPKSLLPLCEIQAIAQLGNADLRIRAAGLTEKRGPALTDAIAKVRSEAQQIILRIPLDETQVIHEDATLYQQRQAAMQLQGDAKVEAVWRLRTAARIRIHGGIPVNDH